jgi:hypothetical protein
MKTLKTLVIGFAALAGINLTAEAQQQQQQQERQQRKEIYTAQLEQARAVRARRTNQALAAISPLITPSHLAACKTEAAKPIGVGVLTTMKVSGAFALSKPYTCIFTPPGLFDPAVPPAKAVYIAPATYVTLLGKQINILAMCTFRLEGGTVKMTVGIAPTKGTQGQIENCGFAL